MTKVRFLEMRRPAWQRFHGLLAKTEQTRRSRLSGPEVSEFSQLFRALCQDLATVRSRDWGSDLERYLNDLVGRGHNAFYRAPPGRPREIVRFFLAGFPRLLRENIAYFWVALLLFCGPAAVLGVLVSRDPTMAARVLPATTLAMLEEMYSEATWRERGGGMEAGMAGFYVRNNVGIAFRCFATGIFCGAGTIYFLVYNGIFLGTTTAYLAARGHADRFFSFVISHGSFELTAIVVSGAAGLVIGHAMVHPGPYAWTEALKRRGLVSVKLAVGAGGMLAVAALIEAFWSPSGLPIAVKYLVGSMLWAVVVVYLTLGGRGDDAA